MNIDEFKKAKEEERLAKEKELADRLGKDTAPLEEEPWNIVFDYYDRFRSSGQRDKDYEKEELQTALQQLDMESFYYSFLEAHNDAKIAIYCGYDFTDKIEALTKPEIYDVALDCLKYDYFLFPKDKERLKSQCAALVPYMPEIIKEATDNYINVNAEYLDNLSEFAAGSRCELLITHCNNFKRSLEEAEAANKPKQTESESDKKADAPSERREAAKEVGMQESAGVEIKTPVSREEEKIDKTKVQSEPSAAETVVESISLTARETEKRAELKRRKGERASNRLAAARKTLAKHIDKALGTDLADRKIPEKAKKVERKINDALFSSKGGKEAE